MSTVNITADALVCLRADKAQAKRFKFNDPTAPWFITEEGQAMAQTALSVDPAYNDYNLARYHYFQYQLALAFNQYEQVLVLGSGFDTRAIRLAQSNGGPNVFEVDLPEVIHSKQRILEEHGINLPKQLKLIGADLASSDLKQTLVAAGFNVHKPTFVMIEGVMFFLTAAITANLLNPAHLGLSGGSRVVFDFWRDERVELMNKALKQATGHTLFEPLPYAHNNTALMERFTQLGYSVTLISLQTLACEQFASEIEDTPPHSWLIAEAHL